MGESMVSKRLLALCWVACASLFFVWSVHAAGNAARGELLAKSCVCHKDGLKGMNKKSFLKKMHGFRDGTLKNENMNKVAKKYTDKDLEDLAAWISAR